MSGCCHSRMDELCDVCVCLQISWIILYSALHHWQRWRHILYALIVTYGRGMVSVGDSSRAGADTWLRVQLLHAHNALLPRYTVYMPCCSAHRSTTLLCYVRACRLQMFKVHTVQCVFIKCMSVQSNGQCGQLNWLQKMYFTWTYSATIHAQACCEF